MYYGRDVKFDETKFKIHSPDSDFWFYEDVEQDEKADADDHESVDLYDDAIKEYVENENGIQQAPEVSEGAVEFLRYSTRIKTKPRWMEDFAVMEFNVEAFLEDVPEKFEDIYRGREDEKE